MVGSTCVRNVILVFYNCVDYSQHVRSMHYDDIAILHSIEGSSMSLPGAMSQEPQYAVVSSSNHEGSSISPDVVSPSQRPCLSGPELRSSMQNSEEYVGTNITFFIIVIVLHNIFLKGHLCLWLEMQINLVSVPA